MPKALIILDYTNDLISHDGVLFCGKGAQIIESSIYDYISEFVSNGDFVANCIDTHDSFDSNHPESKLFPPHNIQGTPGNNIYGEVGTLLSKLEDTFPYQVADFRKNRFSAFVGTKLDLWLRERNVNELYIGGVCTDMCVLHTTIEAYGKGYTITVPRSICYTPDENNATFVFNHFEKCLGIHVI